uniref:Uncharacterized protein n=1 Tax=Anguilla anguilla TaxID=7936 RepID=A0A0E9P8R8_ANGAN
MSMKGNKTPQWAKRGQKKDCNYVQLINSRKMQLQMCLFTSNKSA